MNWLDLLSIFLGALLGNFLGELFGRRISDRINRMKMNLKKADTMKHEYIHPLREDAENQAVIDDPGYEVVDDTIAKIQEDPFVAPFKKAIDAVKGLGEAMTGPALAGSLPENAINAKRVAEILGVSEVTVCARAKKGEIPFYMDGSRRVFDADIIKDFKLPARKRRGLAKKNAGRPEVEKRNPWPPVITQKF